MAAAKSPAKKEGPRALQRAPKSGNPPSSPLTPAFSFRKRLPLALLLAVSAGLGALWQAPREDPLDVPSWHSLRWWAEPFEWNGEATVLNWAGPLTGLLVSSDGKELLLNTGYLLHMYSGDGGWTWEALVTPPLSLSERRGEKLTDFELLPMTRWPVSFGEIPVTVGAGEPKRVLFWKSKDSQRWGVVNEAGALEVSEDGGQHWKFQFRLPHGYKPDAGIELSMRNQTNIWLCDGGLWYSADSGRHWRRQAGQAPEGARPPHVFKMPPFRLPAPWTWLATLAVMGLCVSIYLDRDESPPEESIELALASDRPIGPEDLDALGLDDIAKAISHFLRNEATEPPLTIAVTGNWGSGKSSLMNLVTSDLEKRDWRPVWFNPWHHQKDENLLAPLLAKIMEEAIPGGWTLPGVRYRLRLLLIRSRKRAVTFVILSLILLFSVGWMGSTGTFERALDSAWTLLSAIAAKEAGKEEKPGLPEGAEEPGKPSPAGASGQPSVNLDFLKGLVGYTFQSAPHISSALMFLCSLGGFLVTLWRAASSFGVNPASLLYGERKDAKIKELEEKTGFRYRFAQEFDEVTQALEPRTLLVLVDDLDRCLSESVLDVLEAVNFLTSSGRCYVVLGMAIERVEAGLAATFAKQATGTLPGESVRAYAREYLEKLINIRVAVPKPDHEQSRRLLSDNGLWTSDSEESMVGSSRMPGTTHVRPDGKNGSKENHSPGVTDPPTWKLRGWAQKWLPLAGMLALLILAGVSMYQAGSLLGSWGQERPPRETGSASATSSAQSEPPETPAAPAALLPHDSIKGVIPLPQKCYSLTLVAGLGLVALLALGMHRLIFAPVLVTRNSPEYLKALRKWQPLISERRATPRAMKRFLNHLRFLASRQRAPRESGESMLDAWLRRFRSREEASAPAVEKAKNEEADEADQSKAEEAPLGEALLVALATLRYTFPQWKCGDPLSADQLDFVPEELRAAAEQAAQDSDLYKERFAKLIAGTGFF
jgi:KAP family P-loop domain